MFKPKMEFVPYHIEANDDLDSVFIFNIKNNSEDNPKIYEVRITIDELNDGLVLKKECQCKAGKYGLKDCKHRKYALDELKKWNIEYREDELPK